MMAVALIPAYNEDKTVAGVVKACKECLLLEEVVVISDGSSDQTVQRASSAGARVIDLSPNRGKDYALQAGVDNTREEILVLLDADLLGLRGDHVTALLQPVLEGRVQTTLGVFRHGTWQTDLSQNLTPFLNGQRCMHRQLWLDAVSRRLGVGYGLETVLTRYIRQHGISLARVPLEGVSQVRKEQKVGFLAGLRWRLRMYRQILAALRRR
jgi:glycosyltransferase involved in cell wall biosynthesis